MASNASLSRSVIEAVAAREGVPATELPEPLARAVDPDALDSLFNHSAGHVLFTYEGYEVCVSSTGDVSLTPTEGR
ncbi:MULTISPECIES: HalOD1 output domain-containing protein [Salinibaculum]|uniref:HalOD1 output domain-containing protein n=1 Tax=Salinibaculum TaxID=2732368 RepID=UPI0030D3C245